MKKIKILVVVVVIAMNLMLSGCGYDVAANSIYNIHTYVDDETGVNYIWINSDSGVAICPRYNADGSLYTE